MTAWIWAGITWCLFGLMIVGISAGTMGSVWPGVILYGLCSTVAFTAGMAMRAAMRR